jgi:ketosteroid isomerase-like protein
MHRLRFAFLIAAPLSLGVVPAVAAQDSAASPTPIESVECSVEPITYDDLAQLIATPLAEMTPAVEASPTPLALPDGEPADGETVTAVEQTIQEITACLNDGDFKRVLALYSDDFLREAFAGITFTEEEFDDEFSAPAPRADGEEILIYSFGDVVITEDGRAAVLVLGDDQQNERPASETLFYLVQDGDHWLIDEIIRSPDQGDE